MPNRRLLVRLGLGVFLAGMIGFFAYGFHLRAHRPPAPDAEKGYVHTRKIFGEVRMIGFTEALLHRGFRVIALAGLAGGFLAALLLRDEAE